MERYVVKRVHGFTNGRGEYAGRYTGSKTTAWGPNEWVSGYAVMLGNKVIRCYKQKRIAQLEADFYNLQIEE